MSDDKKPAAEAEQSTDQGATIKGAMAAVAKFVETSTKDPKEFAGLSADDFTAFLNGARATANSVVRPSFPNLRAYTDKETKAGFVLGFIDREDGNTKIGETAFRTGAEKAPAKEQA